MTVSRRSSSVSAGERLERAQLGELAVEDRPARADEARPCPRPDGIGVERRQLRRLLGVDRPPERELVLRLVERSAGLVDPASDVDADGDVERVLVRGQRLVEPAARQVERVARAQGDVQHGLARLAERRAVALILQRQLQHGLVDEPPLRAGDLERDHLVRVVVDR